MRRSLLVMSLSLVALATLAIGWFGWSTVGAQDDEDDGDGGRGNRSGLQFGADLSGAQEVPERDTPASGRVSVTFSSDFSAARVSLKVSDIENVVAAHFHCNRPGLNGPVAFGLFNPGSFEFDEEKGEARGTLTNADFVGADCVPLVQRPVNNIASLAFAMRDGLVYANVHTNDGEDPPNSGPGDFQSGEVRGQVLER